MIKIGTCGWVRVYQVIPPSQREGKSNLQAYAEHYPVVEVNSSFYDFHRVSTYKKWRENTPPDFRFTLKCHQSVSHEERLRPTDKALESLEKMVERGKACKADMLLIQTPGSLSAEDDVFRRADELFDKTELEELALAWETRGESWMREEAQKELARLLEKYDVVHVTDPLKVEPVLVTDLAYFRLHGLPGYNLKYTYTNRQLQELYRKLKAHESKVEVVYAFFNNYAMYRDARRLLALHRNGRLPASPFGVESVAWALRTFEDWPTKKNELVGKCGEWYCWTAPDKSVKLKTILTHLRDREYADTADIKMEAERVWEETGYPSAKEVEKLD